MPESPEERPPFWPPKRPDGTLNEEQLLRERVWGHKFAGRFKPGTQSVAQVWCDDCNRWHVI